jgi:hypothetical protein
MVALLGGAAFVMSCGGDGAAPQGDAAQAGGDGAAPSYIYDPGWPKPLPNNWKMGGVTGLAVDVNDDVWVYDRPNDITAIELHAELTPPTADCCVLPPSMIHIDNNGNVIGSFEAPQGHGMDVDADGFVYLGQDTVRKYDPATGQVIGEIPRTPERENGGPVGLPDPAPHVLGQGGRGPVVGFLAPPGGRGEDPAAAAARAASQAASAAFRTRYPPDTPMIVGGLEEIRIDEAAGEIYVADNYLGGRVLVFDKDTFEFKRGWGAYGKPLSAISTNDADHDYMPGGPMPPDFAGHLTLNFSNDGMVYAADRNANRIHVTDKQGNYMDQEFILAPMTGGGGSTGGVGFSPDPEQRFLYISDLTNNHIWFLNRETGEVVGQMGSMGDSGGLFFGLHMIAIDSTGNIYTGEVFAGERVQRFVPTNSPRGRLLQQLANLQP